VLKNMPRISTLFFTSTRGEAALRRSEAIR
jgi:hypothetical protein